MCVCVTEIRLYVFNVFVSSTEVFVYTSAKRVHVQRQNAHPQHKTCSAVAIVINLFVCSVISYLEMNSRDYLVASNEHIRL